MAAMTMVEGIEIGLKQIAEVASNHNAKIKESNRFKPFLRLSDETDAEPKGKRNNFLYEFKFETTFFFNRKKKVCLIFNFITKVISLSFFPRLTKSLGLVRFLVARSARSHYVLTPKIKQSDLDLS